jgi:hypothetical protein
MVFIGRVRRCCVWRLYMWGPLVRPADHATCRGGQVSSLHCLWTLDTLSTASARHVNKMVFGNVPTHGRPAKVVWPGGHTLARLRPHFVPRHFLVSYCLWLCLIWDIMKICMDFGPYGAFASFDVPEMVDKLMELISNRHLSSISLMKCRYVGGKYLHFMTTNTPPHT